MDRIEIVDQFDHFLSLRPAWQDLWQRSNGFIFQHHDWISGWVNGIRNRGNIRLKTAIAWQGDRMAGVLPLAVHRQRGLRVLNFAAQLFSDYCDGLTDPAQDRAALLNALWSRVWQTGGFDMISLRQVRPDAQARQLLDGLSPPSGRLRLGDAQQHCLRIENRWENGHAFYRSLNKKARNNHTRGQRILAEIGGEPVFRVIEPGADPGPLFDEIWRQKEAWLRSVEPDSPLLGDDRLVLRSVLDSAWRSGLVKIFALDCGERLAAGSINFIYGSRLEAYFTSYDAAFERASPGTILIVEYTRWAFDRGLAHVDFLRGNEAFKFRMANAETLLSSYEGTRTLLGRLAMSGYRWLSGRRPLPPAPAGQLEGEPETA